MHVSGKMGTVSRCEAPGTAVCGCVHVNANVYLHVGLPACL